ncbi:MAG TPA: hypothetical protein PK573_00120 [Spirochaetota bacterium]|nr:hypothetical protein [Spirochaetota bacterium]HRZ26739.1 hypothetical protein [Spirochaetota bacterium]HSA13420.1 hypothetical protein [Spirochaetota bacterium]
MKMMKALMMILAVSAILFPGCDDSSDPVYHLPVCHLRVISLGGGFYGYYIVDGEKVEFSSIELEPGDLYYEYKQEIGKLHSLHVTAQGIGEDCATDDPCTSYLEITLYTDKTELVTQSSVKEEDMDLSVYLSYE